MSDRLRAALCRIADREFVTEPYGDYVRALSAAEIARAALTAPAEDDDASGAERAELLDEVKRLREENEALRKAITGLLPFVRSVVEADGRWNRAIIGSIRAAYDALSGRSA